MTCPFIDAGHRKCEQMLRVEKLLYVMSVCGGNFEHCAIYQEQLANKRETERPERAVRQCA
jgi:hypothetical protein